MFLCFPTPKKIFFIFWLTPRWSKYVCPISALIYAWLAKSAAAVKIKAIENRRPSQSSTAWAISIRATSIVEISYHRSAHLFQKSGYVSGGSSQRNEQGIKRSATFSRVGIALAINRLPTWGSLNSSGYRPALSGRWPALAGRMLPRPVCSVCHHSAVVIHRGHFRCTL